MTIEPTANKFTSAASIFDLIDWIRESGAITVAATRRQLGRSDRQARDYLAFLVRRGLLVAKKRGRVLEYRLATSGTGGSKELSKAVGTEFAVAAVKALEGTAFHAAALEHVITLRESLRDAHAPRAERLRTAFYAVRGSVPSNSEHADHAETILDAIKLGRRISGRYQRLGDGSSDTYELRPVAIVVQPGGLHLLARKLDGKVHTYDVEGFTRVTRLKKESEAVDYDVQGAFKHAFGRYTDFPPEAVVLRAKGQAARHLLRRRFHPSQVVETGSGGSLTARFVLGVCPEFEAWLLGMAGEVEVVEPRELRRKLHERHAAGARAHSVPGSRTGSKSDP